MKILNQIKQIFHPDEKKDWLDILFNNIESAWLQDRHLHFKIMEVKDKGFLVKVGGMFAYLPFQCMPWIYKQLQYWKIVSPFLTGKVFYCKIVKADKVGTSMFNILVDASIHLFRPVELSKDIPYSGVILQKFKYGVFVEVGAHFNWRHGSIVGLVHKTDFAEKESLECCEVGQAITVHYQRQTEKGVQFMEGGLYTGIDWYSDAIKAYLGKEVAVKVSKTGTKITLLVDNCYSAQLRAKTMRKYNVEEKDIILCTITAIDYGNRCFKLELSETPERSNSISNKIDSETLQQLKQLSREVE